jgi:hypothetical protein
MTPFLDALLRGTLTNPQRAARALHSGAQRGQHEARPAGAGLRLSPQELAGALEGLVAVLEPALELLVLDLGEDLLEAGSGLSPQGD